MYTSCNYTPYVTSTIHCINVYIIQFLSNSDHTVHAVLILSYTYIVLLLNIPQSRIVHHLFLLNQPLLVGYLHHIE